MLSLCKRYTPLVSFDDPCGIVLDTTGCASLFGSEKSLLSLVHKDCAQYLSDVKVALAPTPLAARAMARFKPLSIIDSKDMPHALYQLPIEALEIDARSLQTLHELGIHKLLELFRLPRAQLLARFGTSLLDRIDMIVGEKNDPRVFEQETQDWSIKEPLYETIRDTDHLSEALFVILKSLCKALSEQGLGILKLETTLTHVNRQTSQIETSLVEPSSHPEKIFRLLKLKLDNFNAGLGVESILMRAKHTKAVRATETTLNYAQAPTQSDLSMLMDTLFNRIGSTNVFRFSHRQSHIPERSFSQTQNPKSMDCFVPLAMTDAPIRMLKVPEPIDVIAMLPDSPPRRITWRRHFVFDVTKANGPERIESEWWSDSNSETRDYYSIEDKNGLRLWVFKQHKTSLAEQSWFIHGLLA